MPWYVAWSPTPLNGRLGGIYSLPHNYSHWIEEAAFCRRVDRTVRCTPDKHYSLSGALAMSADRWVCSSRPLDPIVTQIVQCTPDSPVLQFEGASLRASLRRLSGGAHLTGYCSLFGVPPGIDGQMGRA
jgi:hypothetical protein